MKCPQVAQAHLSWNGQVQRSVSIHLSFAGTLGWDLGKWAIWSFIYWPSLKVFSLGTFSFLWLAAHKAVAAFQLPPPRLATIGTCLSNCTCNTILAWWTILWFGVTFFILQTSCIEKLKRQKTICAKMEQLYWINCQIACALLRELFLRSPRKSIPMAYIPNNSSTSKSNFRCLSSSYVSWDFWVSCLVQRQVRFHG